jgi:outer membrane protein assembly factor BamB
MWTKPTQAGGIVGGTETESLSYYEGTSYEQRFTMPIIINGILYYNQPLNHRDVHSRDYNTMKGQEYVAVDLRTGEELWRDVNLGIERATIYEYYSPNQHGAQAYLWQDKGNGNLTAYDPFTGALLFNIYNHAITLHHLNFHLKNVLIILKIGIKNTTPPNGRMVIMSVSI